LFALYWRGLLTWFHQDDFAWLGLHLEIHQPKDLLRVLFEPRAQGTIRPLSERGFFLVFQQLFGLDALPFRIWVFLTMTASLLLLHSVTLRLTASRIAAFAAPTVWLMSIGLATPLSWTSAYNQILCGFLFLAAFRLLLAWIDTSRRRYLLAQYFVFLLSLGALEIAVVYPFLALAYLALHGSPRVKRFAFAQLLPMAGLAIAYAALHFVVADKPKTGVYAQHWDAAIAVTYWKYWVAQVTGGANPFWAKWPRDSWKVAGTVLGVTVLLYSLVKAFRGNDRAPLYGLAWFSIVLSPILPLRDHFSEYYLAVPAIGYSLAVACLARDSIRQPRLWLPVLFLLIGVQFVFAVSAIRATLGYRFQVGHMAKTFCQGIERASVLHPEKTILLARVPSDLFWLVIVDRPQRLITRQPVYLIPGAEKSIDAHPELGQIAPFVAPGRAAYEAIHTGQAVVYAWDPPVLRNVTRSFEDLASTVWKHEMPRFVDAGQAAFATMLGPMWYDLESGFRWMPRSASVRIAAPSRSGEKLWVSGYCPESFLAANPRLLTVRINGIKLDSVRITPQNPAFEFAFPLPDQLVGAASMLLELEVDRTSSIPGDEREFGLAFGRFAIR